MFEFLKSKPAPSGPVEFELAVEVGRPAAEVYALLDWADPRNAKRQLGHSIAPIDSDPARWRLVMTEMPDHRFDMTIIEAVPHRSYAFSTDIQPRVGRLESDEERYSIEALGEDRCQLSLVTIAEFQDGLSMKQFEQELAMMTLACQRALIKLKLHAEQGLDALRALEAQIG